MNYYHLKYFFDSVKEGSLQKAARINHVTPGAISQAIIKLEHDFNLSLIHHSKNKFHVTEHGELLYSLCPQLFASVNTIRTKMEDARDPFTGTIMFGTQQSLAYSILPGILAEFKNKYPKILVDFTLGHSTHLKRMMKQQEIDFAISIDNHDFTDHHKIPLFNGNFVFISSSKSKNSLNKGLLVTGITLEVYQLDKFYKESMGHKMPIQMRVDSWGVIKKMALEGHGVGFIPDYLLNKEERKYILKHPNLPKLTYSICCMYPKSHNLNEKTKSLFKIFKNSL